MVQRRKKLIEVALPLEAINREAAREKSIRHGHPSTLHLWWARRPLAACRAVLFAQLVDDPSSDPQYRIGQRVDEERASGKRAELFDLIEDLVKWENSNNPDIINKARAEIARCVASRKIELGDLKQATIIFGRDEGQEHPNGPISTAGVTAYEIVLMRCTPEVVNHFLATYAPPVLDPFAGGGSIPLEAQRLGLRAHASDLNPVPVLINKALIEIPPKFAGHPPINPAWQHKHQSEKTLHSTSWHGAQGLAEDVRYYGEWMRNEAEKRIGHLYPKVKITQDMIDAGRGDLEPYLGQELTVIAWLWARTVKSPNPVFADVDVPLASTFMLSTKKGKETYIEPVIENGGYRFTVKVGKQGDAEAAKAGTKLSRGANFRCLMSSMPIIPGYIRSEAQAGRMGVRLMAIVAEGERRRVYLAPLERHEAIPKTAKPTWKPEFKVSTPCHDVDRLPMYGMPTWGDAFTPRQLTALTTFSDLVSEAQAQAQADAQMVGILPDDDIPLDEGGVGPQAYADAVATYLGFAVDRSADFWCSLCTWANQAKNELVAHVFGRQALPMVWDFAEANPFSKSGGNFSKNHEFVVKALFHTPLTPTAGSVQQIDATTPVAYSGELISTDPPYYDNIGYADLSDFFYVWLRRTLKGVYPSLLSTMLTPKAQELIASPHRHGGSKDKAARFFEDGLGNAIGEWRKHGPPPMQIILRLSSTHSSRRRPTLTGPRLPVGKRSLPV